MSMIIPDDWQWWTLTFGLVFIPIFFAIHRCVMVMFDFICLCICQVCQFVVDFNAMSPDGCTMIVRAVYIKFDVIYVWKQTNWNWALFELGFFHMRNSVENALIVEEINIFRVNNQLLLEKIKKTLSLNLKLRLILLCINLFTNLVKPV